MPDSGYYFYYIRRCHPRRDKRTVKGHPIACVCLKKFEDKWARGVSICADDELFVKTRAQWIAAARCNMAAHNKYSKHAINMSSGSKRLNVCWAAINVQPDTYKSQWDAILTDKEREIVKTVNELQGKTNED